ncbi:MAG: hypothetical protein ACLRM9_03105 [Collinsella aerofaciens]
MLKKTLAFALSAALSRSRSPAAAEIQSTAQRQAMPIPRKTEQAADAPEGASAAPSPPTRWPTAPIRSP